LGFRRARTTWFQNNKRNLRNIDHDGDCGLLHGAEITIQPVEGFLEQGCQREVVDFAFRGLLHCAYDNCLVTAELKKAVTSITVALVLAGSVRCRISAKKSWATGSAKP